MNAKDMWEIYSKSSTPDREIYEEWAFGSEPDKLADLVLQGIKTSTTSAYALYEIDGEPLPEAGDYSVILDSQGNAKCIIKNTKVYITTFDKVSESHAYKEGEGDRSLDYWRRIHREFFTECMGEAGMTFSDTMEVVCEEFEVVYRPVAEIVS